MTFSIGRVYRLLSGDLVLYFDLRPGARFCRLTRAGTPVWCGPRKPATLERQPSVRELVDSWGTTLRDLDRLTEQVLYRSAPDVKTVRARGLRARTSHRIPQTG